MVRVRLDTDQRREQLLRVGIELLGARPAVFSINAVARAAGVSKGLLYHYFQDKEEFLVAVLQAAADELVAATEPDPGLPPLEQIEHAIDGLIGYAESHAAGYIAIFGGQLGIPGVAEVMNTRREQRITRFVEHIARMSPGDPQIVRRSRVLKIAIDGQLAFLETSVLHWLEHRDLDRARLHRFLVNSFLMSMLAVHSVDPGLRLDDVGTAGQR